MQPREIIYGERFLKELAKLPRHVREKAAKQIQVFQRDPLYPSLRVHQLSGRLAGLSSMSITSSHRILFQIRPDGAARLISVGTHAIYER